MKTDVTPRQTNNCLLCVELLFRCNKSFQMPLVLR